MGDNLDLKDRKILFELDKNARSTNSNIAKEVGLSKDSVGYRIKQLEKRKVLSGYRTIINYPKIGYTRHRVAFQLIDIKTKTINEMISFLKKEKGIWGVGHNDGEWDITMMYYSKRNTEFYGFYQRFMNEFRKFVKDKLIGEVLKYDELGRNYLINNKSRKFTRIIFEEERVNCDELDLEILSLLSHNARIKLIDLAEKLKLSSMLIHQRIKKLEKNKIIEGYKADINILELGRDYYGVKMNLKNYLEKDKIFEEIYKIPEMTAVLYAINGYDLEFDLEILGTKKYHEIVNSLRTKFSTIREIKMIRSIEFHLFKNNLQ